MSHVEDRWWRKIDGKRVPRERNGLGRRWKARYIAPDGRERSQMFDRRQDADAWLAEMQSTKNRGVWVDHTNQTTVSEYAKSWAAARPHRASTARTVESRIAKHIEGTRLGKRRLSAVTPSEVQAWATDRATVLKPSTLTVVVGLLRSVMNAAVQDRLIAVSPAVRLSLPRQTRDRVVPLSVAQVQTLADTVNPKACSAMVVVQAALGLRIGELLALRESDVNFLKRTVRVEHQLSPDGKLRLPPKTPRSQRTVPLPQIAGEALAEHLRQWPTGDTSLIFTTPTGLPWRADNYRRRVFEPGVTKAKLPAGTTTHDLRHHYASVLLAAGESVVAVADRLGHDNATLVMKVYGHLLPDSEDRTRKAIDSAWKKARTAPSRPNVKRAGKTGS